MGSFGLSLLFFSAEAGLDLASLFSRRLSDDNSSLNVVDLFFSDFDVLTELSVVDRGPSDNAMDTDAKLMSMLSSLPTLFRVDRKRFWALLLTNYFLRH
jgi:hypothetical protein